MHYSRYWKYLPERIKLYLSHPDWHEQAKRVDQLLVLLVTHDMRDIGRAAFGLEPLKNGSINCNGSAIESITSAIDNNMAYISKNRDREALIAEGSIQDNIIMPSLRELSGKMAFNSVKKFMNIKKEEK